MCVVVVKTRSGESVEVIDLQYFDLSTPIGKSKIVRMIADAQMAAALIDKKAESKTGYHGGDWRSRVKRFELTATDWQLFSHNEEQAAKSKPAVEALNRVLAEAVDECDTWQEAQRRVYAEMDKWIERGARDTEPECELCEFLEILYDLPNGTVER